MKKWPTETRSREGSNSESREADLKQQTEDMKQEKNKNERVNTPKRYCHRHKRPWGKMNTLSKGWTRSRKSYSHLRPSTSLAAAALEDRQKEEEGRLGERERRKKLDWKSKKTKKNKKKLVEFSWRGRTERHWAPSVFSLSSFLPSHSLLVLAVKTCCSHSSSGSSWSCSSLPGLE